MTHEPALVKEPCRACGEQTDMQDIPVWREFTIFGVTWIFGRWKREPMDTCIQCSVSRDNERDRAIFEAGEEHGYGLGFKDAANRRGDYF